MDIPTLKRIVQAIRTKASDQRLVLFGSASLLGSFPEMGEQETMVRLSRDADFVLDPWDDDMALAVHHLVGARHAFDLEHGYYADIVRPMAFENFPPGWEQRLLPLEGCARVFCLEPHDMAVAKLFAGRPKDVTLLSELIREGLLDVDMLAKRLFATPMTEAWIVRTDLKLREVAEKGGKPLPL